MTPPIWLATAVPRPVDHAADRLPPNQSKSRIRKGFLLEEQENIAAGGLVLALQPCTNFFGRGGDLAAELGKPFGGHPV
jgi:hypothetical protein